jgi:hypothetical protein
VWLSRDKSSGCLRPERDSATLARMPEITTQEQAEQALAGPGGRRLDAIAAQLVAEEELRPLIRPALATGIGLRRARELTGLSVTTLRMWRDAG